MDALRTENLRQALGRAQAEGIAFSQWVLPRSGRARFHLGAEPPVVPYAMDTRLLRVSSDAATELTLLFVKRHRTWVGESLFDRLMVVDWGVEALIRPRSFAAPEGLENVHLRAALEEAPLLCPYLDSGMLASWLGVDGAGRALLGSLSSLFETAVAEGAGQEDTVLFALGAWVATAERCFDVLSEMKIPEPYAGVGVSTLAAALYFVTRVALRLRSSLRDRDRLVAEFLCHPHAFLRMKRGAAAASHTDVFSKALLGEARRTLTDTLRSPQGRPFDAIASEAAVDRRAVLKEVAASRIRRELLAWLRVTPEAAGEVLPVLGRSPARLVELFDDRSARRALEAQLGEPAVGRLARWNGRRPERAFEKKADAQEALADAIMQVAVDSVLGDCVESTLATLRPRSGEETDRTLDGEWHAGKLYWFGREPILRFRDRSEDEQGHYFVDVKDFTLRTARLKEDVMGELLRTRFYQPILRILRGYHYGLESLGDRGGIHLNNLLGDAVSASGDIVSLLEVQRQTRAEFNRYATELSERDRRDEEIAAGSFISYGATPVVLAFDDQVWGQLKVAISERINESARGTARSVSVLAVLKKQLIEARLQRGQETLELPFRVYASEGALYNVGDACSAAALDAYRQRREQRSYVELLLRVAELPPEAQRNYWFSEPELHLIAGHSESRVNELFRRVGEVVFRGLETQPVVEVWEVLDPSHPATRLIAGAPALLGLLQ